MHFSIEHFHPFLLDEQYHYVYIGTSSALFILKELILSFVECSVRAELINEIEGLLVESSHTYRK